MPNMIYRGEDKRQKRRKKNYELTRNKEKKVTKKYYEPMVNRINYKYLHI